MTWVSRFRRKSVLFASLAVFALVAAACQSAVSTPTATAPAPTPTPAPQVATTPEPTPTGPALIPTPIPTPTIVPTPAPTLGVNGGPAPIIQLPDVASVVARVRLSVVSVVAEAGGNGFASGSGVLFDGQGHILTNNHVIQDATSVSVTLDDGQQLDARIVGADPLTDLTVLQIEGSYPHLPFADPASVRVGEWVIAIGNALALPGGPTVTLGIVSAVDRSFAVQQGQTLYSLIQTDTIINPGNSGGPLLNLAGEIVGINTAVLRGGRVEGIGFAVSGETAIPVSEELVENGRVRWAWLGVVISDLSAEEAARRNLGALKGILVVDVVEDGPAWQAGLREDAVLLSIAGRGTPTIKDLTLRLRDFRAGDAVDVGVWRGDQRQTVNIALGERPVG